MACTFTCPLCRVSPPHTSFTSKPQKRPLPLPRTAGPEGGVAPIAKLQEGMPLLSLLKGMGRQRLRGKSFFPAIGSSGVTNVIPEALAWVLTSAYRQGLLRGVSLLKQTSQDQLWHLGCGTLSDGTVQGSSITRCTRLKPAKSTLCITPRGFGREHFEKAAFYMHKEWFWPRRIM